MSKRIFCLVAICLSLQLAAQQLVLRGDYPDPSVVKIGDTYWATATTSNWAPAYPLLKSTDLVNWQTVGHVFNQLPAWADYYFWAPEIVHENGKTYIYYSAHKRGGNLCVGIASADTPEGPYRDHGPIICEEVGSIDAFPIRDENGKLHMIWKEDANSVGKPTPIWIQELNEERTALVGEKKLMFKNDAPWEANLVEGVAIQKHGEYFYAFYAAAGCCGRGCTYANGVARSKKLLGPWEKDPKNPVLIADGKWKCPGHGTPVEMNGRNYFMYHAYNRKDDVYVGRQGLIMEYEYTRDGWVKFIPDANVPALALSDFSDNFTGRNIGTSYQWSVFQQPKIETKRGILLLHAQAESKGTFVAQKTVSSFYTATAKIRNRRSNAYAGLGVIGDDKNFVAAYVSRSELQLVQVKDGKDTTLYRVPVRLGRNAFIRMDVSNGKDINFSFSADGKNYQLLNRVPIDGHNLPPWDRAVRIGLLARGTNGRRAEFDQLIIENR